MKMTVTALLFMKNQSLRLARPHTVRPTPHRPTAVSHFVWPDPPPQYPHKRSNNDDYLKRKLCVSLSTAFCEFPSDSGPMVYSTGNRKSWNYGMLHHHEPELELSPRAPCSSFPPFCAMSTRGTAMGIPRGKKIQLPDTAAQSGVLQTFCHEARLCSFSDCASEDVRAQ